MNDYLAFILISIGVTFTGLQLDSNMRDDGAFEKNRSTYVPATADMATTETPEDGGGAGWEDE